MESQSLQTHQKTQERLSVIIAAYNEEKTIAKIIDAVLAKKIKHLDIEIIIVESNSKDNTRNILKNYSQYDSIRILLQDKPSGKGNAIRAGLRHAKGNYILIQDADDEYDINDYDSLLYPLMTGQTKFVLGARHGGKAWKMREFNDHPVISHIFNFGHLFFTFLVNKCFGLNLKDPFSMFKVFRSECLDGLNFECNRFDFDLELLIKLTAKGYIPVEVPVNYRSRSFKEGKKIRIFRDPLTWVYIILKLWRQRKAI